MEETVALYNIKMEHHLDYNFRRSSTLVRLT